MNEIAKTIVDGLIQAAAVAFVAALFGWIWRKWLLPKWRIAQIESKTANLNDTYWEVTREEQKVGTAKLSQSGDGISARVDFGSDGHRKFRYRGIIRADMIRMEWAEEGLAKLNFGSLNLKVSADSNTLRGYTTFVHRDQGKVVSRYTEWRRLSSPPLASDEKRHARLKAV